MTFDIAENAPERTRNEVERLHEPAVNEFGYYIEHVLFTANDDGTIPGRIALYVAGDYHDCEDGHDSDENQDRERERERDHEFNDHEFDHDPDPRAIGARVSTTAADATDESAEVGA